MSSYTRLRGAIVIAAVATLALSACSSSNSSSASSPSPSAKRYSVVYIQQNTGNPYFDDIASGFKASAQALGFDVTVTGPPDAGAASQIPYIQQAIVKHVDAIAIQPSDPKAVLPALEQAKAAGIKILEVNIDSVPSVRIAAVTALDYSLVAPSQMEELGKLMNYKGDFAILSATTTAPFQKMVIGSALKILKSDPKYKNMHLVKIAYGNDVPATSTQQTQALLTAYPNLKAIYAPTTVAIAAAAQTVESAGKAKSIIVTGLGDPMEMKKFVLDGTVTEFQLWAPSNMGLAGGYIIVDALKARSLQVGGTISVPTLGDLKIIKGGVIPCQNTLTTFTAANIAQYNY